ncbi:hypothetical protein WOLCODRAFT_134488 [Wolfiporia cocos MD-104 SS10]|uniref:Methyltransferase n=1 Tax=Wolfiporia cocos (strain MD-104) TaxID=742152 RepID=A0A2H3JMD0_WOLCO|nr:hypothetical protein WOLCODRAFT_134488 [Wolfiporia cocos MD-104 SS10]
MLKVTLMLRSIPRAPSVSRLRSGGKVCGLHEKSPASVTTELLYYSPPPDGSRPYTLINTDEKGRTGNWVPEPHRVEVEDVRGQEAKFTLDTAGFQLYEGSPDHTQFTDGGSIKERYYPESIALIKLLTGASRVVPFDHTIRRRRPGERDDAPEKRQPVPQVHIDQTLRDVPDLLKRRFQILNLWRPLEHPALDWPLALCDYRSINRKRDVVPIALRYPDREGETYGVKYSQEHRWKYLRGMRPDEFVLIKCFDSQDDGKTALFTPHTAFNDPSTPKGSPFRESIELRLLVFY